MTDQLQQLETKGRGRERDRQTERERETEREIIKYFLKTAADHKHEVER